MLNEKLWRILSGGEAQSVCLNRLSGIMWATYWLSIRQRVGRDPRVTHINTFPRGSL